MCEGCTQGSWCELLPSTLHHIKSPRPVSKSFGLRPDDAHFTSAMRGGYGIHIGKDPPSVSAPTPREKSEKEGEAFRLGEFGSSLARGEMDDVLSKLRRTLVVMLGQAGCVRHKA